MTQGNSTHSSSTSTAAARNPEPAPEASASAMDGAHAPHAGAAIRGRKAFSSHETRARGVATTTPAAFLSLGKILALAEKRLHWYGFDDWRIHDVVCNQDHTVSIQVCSGEHVVLTMTFARDCGTARYGVHLPQALRAASGLPPARPAKLARKHAAKRHKSPRLRSARRRDLEATLSMDAVRLDPNERAFGCGRAVLHAMARGNSIAP